MELESKQPVTDQFTFRKILLLLFIGTICIVFLFLDLLTPGAFESRNAFILVLMMNLVVGQLTLICVWGTLVEGTFWIRLPWTILMLVISWAALAGGVRLAKGNIDTAEVLGLGLVWFYAFVISYIPLKLAALGFGWRIQKKDRENSSKAKTNYQIRDMMMGTAILAVTVAIGRMLLPGELPSWENVLIKSGLDEPGPFTALLIFSVASLIVKLPCIWIALAIPVSRIMRYSISWICIAAVLGLLEMGLLTFFLGSPGQETVEFVIGLTLGHAVMAGLMIGVLYLLRIFGYRMSRPKRMAAD